MAYAGFDRDQCPTKDQFQALKQKTNLVWCGYYLHAPSQRGLSWKGKRPWLVEQGWGIAPIFVGQQTVQSGPGSHVVTAAQGKIDGAAAVDVMTVEGFPLGSYVFLDVEAGPPFGFAQRGYVGAWVDELEAGGYRAGIYGSYLLASEFKSIRPQCRLWVFHVRTTLRHPVTETQFPSPEPKMSGVIGAAMWQREMSAVLMEFDGLLVDLDVASMPDPGAPDMVAGRRPLPPAPTPWRDPTLPPDVPLPQPGTPSSGDAWVAFFAAVGRGIAGIFTRKA